MDHGPLTATTRTASRTRPSASDRVAARPCVTVMSSDATARFARVSDAAGSAKRALARREVGGTPATAAAAYAARSPLSYVGVLSSSGVPLQIWWSRTDRVVVQSSLQSGLLAERLRDANPDAPLTVISGDWRHTSVMRAEAALPQMLAGLGLLPQSTPEH